jgi:integrase
LWHATGELGYPVGPLVRLLMWNGARLNEVAGARWREFDLDKRLWVIPAERFKSNSQHIIALSDDMLALLNDLPRWRGGDHLFTTTNGDKPVNSFSTAKAHIDKLMGGDIPHWTFHDIRRTVRTRLSELRTPRTLLRWWSVMPVKVCNACTINTNTLTKCVRRWRHGPGSCASWSSPTRA